MQSTQRPPQKKPSKFQDVKILIASLSIAVTVGLWNVFSSSAFNAEKAKVEPNTAPPPDLPDTNADGLAPLPTLIPLVDIQVPQDSGNVQANDAQPASSSLRSVSAPTQKIVQKVKPVFDQPGAVSVSSGGGGSKRPVATTKSSR